MTKTPPWLNLTFAEQLEYFRSKLPLPTERWNELADSEHDHAFVIAGLTKADLLNDAKDLVERAIASGTGLDEFKQQFRRLIGRRGWMEESTDSRLRTIYDTNLRRSYAAGRYRQMSDPEVLSDRPYWMWRHRTPDPEFGGTPRANHKALNNQIFPASHPFWKKAFPACAFGCRCTAFSVSQSYMERNGLKASKPPNPNSIADPGFRSASGISPESEREAFIKSKLATLDPEVAAQLRRSLRTDSAKPTRVGYHWVEDKSVKKGGYWRKNPKGSKGAVVAASAIAGAAAIGAGIALSRQKPAEPQVTPQKRSGAIAIGATGLGAAGSLGAIAASSRPKASEIPATPKEEEFSDPKFNARPPKFNGRSPDGTPLSPEVAAAVDLSIQNLHDKQVEYGVNPSGTRKDTWKEFGQTISTPDGKTKGIISGESQVVQFRKSDFIGDKNIIVHTHPTSGSLSYGDILATSKDKVDSIVAVDRAGNIYHGKVTPSKKQEIKEGKSLDEEGDEFNEIINKVANDPQYSKLAERITEDYYTKQFVLIHATMRHLKVKGAIDYDYQLTPEFAKLEKEYEGYFQAIEAIAKERNNRG